MKWLLLLPLSLFAYAEIGGTLIYWKPFGANDHYATIWQDRNQADIGEDRFLKPQYNWGWQADANLDCAHANLTAIVFHSQDAQTSSGLFIDDEGIQFVEGSAQISAKQKYVSGDLEAGLCFSERLCLRFSFFAGVRYSYLSWHRDNRAFSTIPIGSSIRIASSSFSGAGPRLRLTAMAFNLCPRLCATLHTSAALLIGRRKLSSHLRETTPIPNLDLRLQLQYTLSSPIICLTAEAGYELRRYFLPLYAPEPVTISNPVPQLRRLGFAGPYAALRVGF